MLNMTLLEQKMNEKGLTYRGISELMGFKSSGTIWKWVHGKNQMRAHHIERLAMILGVPVQSFFQAEDCSQLLIEGGDCE
jgi:transcriptional regulator with XRE-family HTH domain